ncbi:MAG: hypothetical protein KC438_01380 [Thermomicrobiales bacterium]|nr:hypothetical protein [Thermomicrobiales bacterium]
MTVLRKSSPPVVKLNSQTHAKLLEFSKDEQRPMGEIISDLVERYDRERFWKGVEADYARLRADQSDWDAYQADVADWDSLAGDGLENEPPYFTVDEERQIRERAAARTPGRRSLAD